MMGFSWNEGFTVLLPLVNLHVKIESPLVNVNCRLRGRAKYGILIASEKMRSIENAPRFFKKT